VLYNEPLIPQNTVDMRMTVLALSLSRVAGRLFSRTRASSAALCIAAALVSAPDVLAQDNPHMITVKNAQGVCSPVPEICGDGVDQDCNGSDLACPGSDQDRDGSPLGNDCNDFDRFVYPGVYTSCTLPDGKTGTRQCQSNATYSACSATPLCEATAGRTCYYISALTGSDSNPGTFAAPFKTYKNIVSYYQCETQCPPGAKALRAGDVVYFMSGIYRDTYTYYQPNDSGMLFRFVHGTATEPVRIKAYPGAKAILAPPKPAKPLYVLNSSYLIIEGLEITEGWESGIRVADSDNVEIRNNIIHNVDGDGNENMAGLYLVGAKNIRAHHNTIFDNHDRLKAPTNPSGGGNRQVTLFSGGNIRLNHNVIFNSRKQLAGCLLYKHSQDLPGGVFELDYNMFWNCEDTTMGSASYNSRIHHNLVIDSVVTGIRDWGGPAHLRDVDVYNNTFVNMRGAGLYYVPTTDWGPLGVVKFRKNIVAATSVSSPGTQFRGLDIAPYGSDAMHASLMSPGLFIAENNCYWHDTVTPTFGWFSQTSSGALGGIYSLATWQGMGKDLGSKIVDPQIDGFFRPTNVNCAAAGWLAP
jgi:parallel beta-helix repeat protein